MCYVPVFLPDSQSEYISVNGISSFYCQPELYRMSLSSQSPSMALRCLFWTSNKRWNDFSFQCRALPLQYLQNGFIINEFTSGSRRSWSLQLLITASFLYPEKDVVSSSSWTLRPHHQAWELSQESESMACVLVFLVNSLGTASQLLCSLFHS